MKHALLLATALVLTVATAKAEITEGRYLCENFKPYDTELSVDSQSRIKISYKIGVQGLPSHRKITVNYILTDPQRTVSDSTLRDQEIQIPLGGNAAASAKLLATDDSMEASASVQEAEDSTFLVIFYEMSLMNRCYGSSCTPMYSTLKVNPHKGILLKNCRMTGDAY